MAPKRRTSTDSPVGKLAVTLALSWEIDTCGVGMVGETGMAEGFLDRSITFVRLIAAGSLFVWVGGKWEKKKTLRVGRMDDGKKGGEREKWERGARNRKRFLMVVEMKKELPTNNNNNNNKKERERKREGERNVASKVKNDKKEAGNAMVVRQYFPIRNLEVGCTRESETHLLPRLCRGFSWFPTFNNYTLPISAPSIINGKSFPSSLNTTIQQPILVFSRILYLES